MYTVTVTSDRAWLIDPLNTSTKIIFGSQQDAETDALGGEFREYAGSRVQVVLTDQVDTQQIPITLIALSAAEYAQILAWRGKLLLYRGTDGQRMFGSYLSVSKTRHLFTSFGTVYDVALTFQQVTYNEAV